MLSIYCTLRDDFFEVSQEYFQHMMTIEDLIGQGSCGAIYSATLNRSPDNPLLMPQASSPMVQSLKIYQDEIVAVKNFNCSAIENKRLVLSQIRTIQSMNSPYLLGLIGCYKVNMKYYMITEYCPNGNLQDQKVRIKDMSEMDKLNLSLQISKGIQALHNCNIMHRNLKPKNILLDHNFNAKICDFGYSQIKDTLEQNQSLGTSLFWDPQVKTGIYTKKCDIFSLGLVIYWIFAGQTLFGNCRSAQQLNQNQKKYFDNPDAWFIKLSISNQIKELIKPLLVRQKDSKINANFFVDSLNNLIQKMNENPNKKGSSLISTVACTQSAQKIQQIDTLTLKLIFYKPEVQQKKQLEDLKRQLFMSLVKAKLRMEKLRYIEALDIRDYRKQCLAFIIVFYYIRFLLELRKWLQNQSSKIPILSMAKNQSQTVILPSEVVIKVKKFIKVQQNGWNTNLLELATEITPSVLINKNELSHKFQNMVTQISQGSIQKILAYQEDEVRHQYRSFLNQHCSLKEIKKINPEQTNTSKVKENYQFAKNFLDEFFVHAS